MTIANTTFLNPEVDIAEFEDELSDAELELMGKLFCDAMTFIPETTCTNICPPAASAQ